MPVKCKDQGWPNNIPPVKPATNFSCCTALISMNPPPPPRKSQWHSRAHPGPGLSRSSICDSRVQKHPQSARNKMLPTQNYAPQPKTKRKEQEQREQPTKQLAKSSTNPQPNCRPRLLPPPFSGRRVALLGCSSAPANLGAQTWH